MWLAEMRCGELKPMLRANEIRSGQNREPPIPSPKSEETGTEELSVTAEMVGFELTGFRSSVCFTPQDCVLLHVIRDDLTGKHITEVKLTSLLYEISECTLYSYISLCVCDNMLTFICVNDDSSG